MNIDTSIFTKNFNYLVDPVIQSNFFVTEFMEQRTKLFGLSTDSVFI